jgi:hypothetical protein
MRAGGLEHAAKKPTRCEEIQESVTAVKIEGLDGPRSRDRPGASRNLQRRGQPGGDSHHSSDISTSGRGLDLRIS